MLKWVIICFTLAALAAYLKLVELTAIFAAMLLSGLLYVAVSGFAIFRSYHTH